jgi:hypothetical protein
MQSWLLLDEKPWPGLDNSRLVTLGPGRARQALKSRVPLVPLDF